MKANRFVLMLIAALASSLSGQESDNAPTESYVMNARSQKPVEMNRLLDDLARYDVIFLGELHDNDAGHVFQLSVIQGLVDRGLNVVVSMEQFERDVQGVVDDYVSGRTTEEQFLEHSRPWKNYEKHYRPIVELARSQKIPVLAGNVPRRLAADVSQNRTASSADQVFLPRTTTAPRDAYWEHFMDSMKGHGGTEDDDKMASFYAAQCLKDDAMAESITDYLDTNPHLPRVVIHLCGKFHSDHGLGTVSRVLERKPFAWRFVSSRWSP